MSGVYALIVEDEILYVGSTTQLFRDRWMKHNSDLRLGTHTNQILARYYRKNGKQPLKFVEIEFCSKENVRKRERYWINLLKPKYNILKSVGDKFEQPEETKDKISLGAPNRQTAKLLKADTKFSSLRKAAEALGVSHNILYYTLITNKQEKFLLGKDALVLVARPERKVKERKKTAIVCNETKEVFDSYLAAAIKYNVSEATIRNNVYQEGNLRCSGASFSIYNSNFNAINESINNILVVAGVI